MAAAAFTVEAGFTVRVVSEAFMAGVFTAEAASQGFTGAILGTFTAGVSLGFTAMAVFLAIIGFSFPASMDIRGGGVGVTPIRIGVIRTTPITPTIRITRISRSRRVARRIFLAGLRCSLRRVLGRDTQCDLGSRHYAPAGKRNHDDQLTPYCRLSASSSSRVRGHSDPNSRDKLRSARTTPPVWHRAQ
jgi:hypothetical protein